MCYYSSMSNNKTLAELEKRLKKIENDIIDAETKIGDLLFASDTGEVSHHKGEFDELVQKKEGLRKEIEVIRNLEETQIHLKKDIRSLEEQEHKLNAGWGKLYESLGVAIATSHSMALGEGYNQFKADIEETEQKKQDLEAILKDMKSQMENQNFVNKLVTQVQYTTKKGVLVQLTRKLSSLYNKCGKVLFERGDLAKSLEAHTLSSSVVDAYIPCNDLQQQIIQLQEKTALNKNQLAENIQSLEEHGIKSDNVDKGIKGINVAIDEIIEKQNKL